MKATEVDEAKSEALLQQLAPAVEFQNDSQSSMEALEGKTRLMDLKQGIHNFKQLKSFHITKSALMIFTSNIKLTFLMIFSIIPFFVFMVFYEMKLHKAIVAAPGVLLGEHVSFTIDEFSLDYLGNEPPEIDYDKNRADFMFEVLQLCLLYLVMYPLLEFINIITTIQTAAKVYAGQKPNTLKDIFYGKNNLRGILVTYSYVHLLSCLALLALIWVFVSHLIFLRQIEHSFYGSWTSEIGRILSVGFHTMIFVALQYKYLDWSAFWNMTMVISILDEENGLAAFHKANYYVKHCKTTGFQLMLGFLGFSLVLRLPCLYVYDGLSDWRIFEAACVIGFLCLGNLVKWVAFVLYCFDCKQQTMEKKTDEEIGKAVTVG